MPDDEIVEEVAEQVVDQLVDDNAEDEDAVFETEDDGTDLGMSGEPEKKAETKEDPDEKKTDDEPRGDDAEDPDDEDTDAEDEDDEDIKRGKELIEQRKAAEEAEAAKKAEAEEDTKDAGKAEDGADTTPDDKYWIDSYTNENIELLHDSLPRGLFPDKEVTLPDGTVLDYSELVKENPELPSYIAGIANHVVRNMLSTGFIIGKDHLQEEIGTQRTNMDKALFTRSVTNPNYGVPKAKEVIESDGFKKWWPEQADEIKALFTSKDPHDYIRGLKRFLNQGVFDKADKENAEKDNKRKSKKKNFDAVHKTTAKSGKRPKKSKVTDTPADEDAAFESDDDDDALY